MGTAQNALDAISQAGKTKVDVIIVGMCHPEQHWLQTIAHLVENIPQAKVVALSISASQTSLAQAIRLGATHYIPEGSTAFEMQEIIRRSASLAVHPIST
jgi:DNA-binding NarL/FixJ family response regulator